MMRTTCVGGVLVPIAVGVLLTTTARGDDFNWSGDGGASFHDAKNWISGIGGPPGADDRGIFALDEAFDVWLNFQPDQDRVGQVRVEAGMVNLRILTTAGHFQMLGSGPLAPALQIVAAEGEVTELAIEAIGSDVARTLQIGEIVLGELDATPGGTALLTAGAQSTQLELDVARGVTIGVGAMHATMALGDLRRLTTQDLTIAAGGPAAAGVLDLNAAETFVSGLLRVGASGSGQVEVTNGGRLECFELQLGGLSDADGAMVISGADSECRVASFCDIGYSGSGAVTIADGGQFTSIDDVFVGFITTMTEGGELIPSHGHVSVDGANAEFLALEDLWLGFAGAGSVRSTNGGRFNVHGALYSGNATGTHVEIVLVEPDGDGPIIDVDGPIAPLRYAIGLDASAAFDGSESWTIVRSGAALATPLEINTIAGDGAWRPVATVLADRIVVSLVSRVDPDGSGTVDFGDLLFVLGAWGACPGPDCPADLDGSGVVDFDDLLIVLANWSTV